MLDSLSSELNASTASPTLNSESGLIHTGNLMKCFSFQSFTSQHKLPKHINDYEKNIHLDFNLFTNTKLSNQKECGKREEKSIIICIHIYNENKALKDFHRDF